MQFPPSSPSRWVAGSFEFDCLLDNGDLVKIGLVVVLMLAPVDGAELEEAELGGIAAQARGAALHRLGAILALLRNFGEGLGGKRLLGPLGARIRVGCVGGQREEGGRPALNNLRGEIDDLLAQLAELLGGWGRHFL